MFGPTHPNMVSMHSRAFSFEDVAYPHDYGNVKNCSRQSLKSHSAKTTRYPKITYAFVIP